MSTTNISESVATIYQAIPHALAAEVAPFCPVATRFLGLPIALFSSGIALPKNICVAGEAVARAVSSGAKSFRSDAKHSSSYYNYKALCHTGIAVSAISKIALWPIRFVGSLFVTTVAYAVSPRQAGRLLFDLHQLENACVQNYFCEQLEELK